MPQEEKDNPKQGVYILSSQKSAEPLLVAKPKPRSQKSPWTWVVEADRPTLPAQIAFYQEHTGKCTKLGPGFNLAL